MSELTIKRLSANRLTAGMARTTAPSTGSDGCDISSWATIYGDRVPVDYLLRIGCNQAATVTGATLWLYFADLSLWSEVGLLGDKGDGNITVTGASQDHAEVVSNIGLASRMAVVGTWSAGTPSASCTPLEEKS